MLRFGNAPHLECSTRGDRRFSAFVARPASLRGLSIEEAYQTSKILADGTRPRTWREGKGKKAVNAPELAHLYDRWWLEWVTQENLLPLLQAATGLQDTFGQPGHLCQAEVLWRIRNGLLR